MFGLAVWVTQQRRVYVCALTCEMNGDLTGRRPQGFMTTDPLTSLCLLTVFLHVRALHHSFSTVCCGLAAALTCVNLL